MNYEDFSKYFDESDSTSLSIYENKFIMKRRLSSTNDPDVIIYDLPCVELKEMRDILIKMEETKFILTLQ